MSFVRRLRAQSIVLGELNIFVSISRSGSSKGGHIFYRPTIAFTNKSKTENATITDVWLRLYYPDEHHFTHTGNVISKAIRIEPIDRKHVTYDFSLGDEAKRVNTAALVIKDIFGRQREVDVSIQELDNFTQSNTSEPLSGLPI